MAAAMPAPIWPVLLWAALFWPALFWPATAGWAGRSGADGRADRAERGTCGGAGDHGAGIEADGAGERQPGHADHEGDDQHRGQRRHGHPGRPVEQRPPEPLQRGTPGPRVQWAFHRAPDRGGGECVPGARVDHPGEPGHGHDSRRVQVRHQRRGQGQDEEGGDQPGCRAQRRQPPPPGRAHPALAQRHGGAQQDRHRGQVGPGEREQGHPEHQGDDRGHDQADQDGQRRAGDDRAQEARSGQARDFGVSLARPGQLEQDCVHGRPGQHEQHEGSGKAEPGLVEGEQPAQIVIGRQRRERRDLRRERTGRGREE